MKNKTLASSLILTLAAAIWGFAFVAQRVGAQHMGAFAFNGIRFMLGSLSLVPLILYRKKAGKSEEAKLGLAKTIQAGVFAGLLLFAASALQQQGMADTESGKAAFITGLYIVIVPILGLFFKHRVGGATWVGIAAASFGLYLLCVTDDFSISKSDIYIIIGAVIWAGHILLIDYLARNINALALSFCQFLTCGLLSLAAALLFEEFSLNAIQQAALPLLYGGVCSVGVAYTLQVVGQKYARPAYAAIILSMETLFATLGGYLILGETIGLRGAIGCIFMFAGMLLPQFKNLLSGSKLAAQKAASEEA